MRSSSACPPRRASRSFTVSADEGRTAGRRFRTARADAPRVPGSYPPRAVTFLPILYSKMNMNRNPRNPLKTNDPCTLYSKTKRVLHWSRRSTPCGNPSLCQSSHSPGHCPLLLDTRARHASPYLQQNKRPMSPLLDTRFRRAAKRAASVPASPPPCFPASGPVRYHEVRNIATERRAQLSSAPTKRKPRRSEA